MLEKFRDSAQALVDKLGAVDAVAASLAHISGTKEIKARSLLTGREVWFMTLLYEACFGLVHYLVVVTMIDIHDFQNQTTCTLRQSHFNLPRKIF